MTLRCPRCCSVIKGIVELHKGTVRAVSDGENMGCTFILDLPVKKRTFDASASMENLTRGGSETSRLGPAHFRINSWVNGDCRTIIEEASSHHRLGSLDSTSLHHLAAPQVIELHHHDEDGEDVQRKSSVKSILSRESLKSERSGLIHTSNGFLSRRDKRVSAEESSINTMHRRSIFVIKDISELGVNLHAPAQDEFSLSTLYTSNEGRRKTRDRGHGRPVTSSHRSAASSSGDVHVVQNFEQSEINSMENEAGSNVPRRPAVGRRQVVRWLSMSSYSSSNSSYNLQSNSGLSAFNIASNSGASGGGSGLSALHYQSSSSIANGSLGSAIHPDVKVALTSSSKVDLGSVELMHEEVINPFEQPQHGSGAAPVSMSSADRSSPSGTNRGSSDGPPSGSSSASGNRSKQTIDDEIQRGGGTAIHPVNLSPAGFRAVSLREDLLNRRSSGPIDSAEPGQRPAQDYKLKKALVVDDSVINRKMMVRMLKRRANVCNEAGDGKQAVDMYMDALTSGDPYDLILMDYMMPVMDGAAAAKELRALGYSSLLIGITGNALPCDLLKFMESGLDDVLTKPFDIDVFDRLLQGNNSPFAADIVSLCIMIASPSLHFVIVARLAGSSVVDGVVSI